MTKLYHKRDDFSFRITNFSFVYGNNSSAPVYGIFRFLMDFWLIIYFCFFVQKTLFSPSLVYLLLETDGNKGKLMTKLYHKRDDHIPWMSCTVLTKKPPGAR